MDEISLDQNVMVCLNGIDLEKYIPFFQRHKVDMELFVSMNDDDLRTIGITDQNDIELLQKYINKFKRNDLIVPYNPLRCKEIQKGIKDVAAQLNMIRCGSIYLNECINENTTLDFITSDNDLATNALLSLCDNILLESSNFLTELHPHIPTYVPEKMKPQESLANSKITAGDDHRCCII